MIRLVLAAFMLVAALPARADVDIQEITTPGGIDAWLVEDHSIPFVALELRFRGGTSLDAPGKRGAVNLMTGLLEEGAGDLDARAFSRAADSLAASFSYDAGPDSLSVSARFLTENRDESMALLKDSLVEPRFDEEAIERVRAQILSIIQSDQKDPEQIARARFDSLVYGDHPYGSDENGTVDSVGALSREDIVAAHRATLARDRLYVSAVGDIDSDELASLLDTLLGDLPESGAPLPDDATLNLPGGIKVVDYATPQSIAIFAQPGLEREDPDFFPAFVLNHILGGGGFESRLMTEVREKRGLTYGVYSYLADRDDAQVWMGSVASANDRVAQAVEVIQAEWQRIREEGVTQEELDDAKTYLTGAYPLRFDGNGTIANIAVGMQMDGLGTEYIANRNDKVNAVTLEDVNRVAREWLDPEALTFVVTGQPEGLTDTLN
ncbi:MULTISPECIES: M16 family metallopeptidase [Roseovarius]|uniref:M16 family metallopeptidase n=1 Tax=Roseovarius TaxID=74030 RepID=UPI001C973F88|nr:pitrilysin family protein [Roseovarius atlanticus]MBY5987021.1 insulinase family protein [Roseovarius atlanticus]MBY6125661.1 insulinase family protein [Roseovarius atlanticus]MBY6149878.1 insulinase family protein [Roseovarius atlanticus]